MSDYLNYYEALESYYSAQNVLPWINKTIDAKIRDTISRIRERYWYWDLYKEYAKNFISSISDRSEIRLEDFLYLLWFETEIGDNFILIEICDLWLERFPDNEELKKTKANALWSNLFYSISSRRGEYDVYLTGIQLYVRSFFNWSIGYEELSYRLEEIRKLDPNQRHLQEIEKGYEIAQELKEIQLLWNWNYEQKKEAYSRVKELYLQNPYSNDIANVTQLWLTLIAFWEELWFHEEIKWYIESAMENYKIEMWWRLSSRLIEYLKRIKKQLWENY